MANVFQLAVLYFCLVVIAAIVVASAFFGLKRVVEILRTTLAPATLAVFLGAVGVITVIAQKRGGDEAVGTPSRSFGEAALLPLPGSVTNEKWRVHGAYQNWMHIPATNWWARSPSGCWLDHVTAFAWCEFRPDLFTTNAWPRPFPERLSLAAEANWPLLTNDEPQATNHDSLFWHAATPSNTLVMTWLGGLYARSHTNQVDFQAELFNDGSVDYRYADRTERYAATLPFDLDGDGLENSVDPDPFTAGPDAHGTNAEWYNTVCSNVFEAVATSCDPPGSGAGGAQLVAPVELTWREGVNSNAYYFVDVVTERGPAPIYFTGDRDSRLGNPVIVALAGVTNRVPLLIGIDYAVTSDTPFSVSFPVDYMHPTVTTNGAANYNVRWPLNFVFAESIGASNRLYTVTVEPYDPGGVLEWNDSGGVPMRGEPSNDGCDCVDYGFFSFWFTCSSSCACSMGCTAEGCYHLEDASFLVSGGQCRCGFDDPPPDSPPTSHEPNDPPSLMITFSKPTVIFEEAYDDEPGKMEPRRSTRVRLTIDAYGGTQGGALWLTESNMGKLTAVSGGVSLPHSQNLAAGQSYHATGVYEGAMASGSNQDVKVSGIFVPDSGSSSIAANAKLTAMQIRLTPEVAAPDNVAPGRHTYGVCERMLYTQFPNSPTVVWNPVGGGSNGVDNALRPFYQFPLFACVNPLRVDLGDVTYTPRLTCIEPSGIVSGKVELCTYGLPPGKAGGIGLWQEFRVTPLTVSFFGIAVEEVPCDQGTIEGYFRYAVVTSRWTHTREAGAGKWYNVDRVNRVGGENDVHDEAGIAEEAFPITPEGILTNDYSFGWMDGSMVWQVPFGWHARGTKGEVDPYKTFGTTTQEFYIDPWGRTGVRKFKSQATRLPNDRRFLGAREIFNNMVITNKPSGR